MITKITTAVTHGIEAKLFTIEVDVQEALGNAKEAFIIGGLGDHTVTHTRNRIIHAINNSGYDMRGKRIVINISGEPIKKHSYYFDSAIAIGILNGIGSIAILPERLRHVLFLGELGLDGSLKMVNGALPIAYSAYDQGITEMIVSHENAQECALVPGLKVIALDNLDQLVQYLQGNYHPNPVVSKPLLHQRKKYDIDFADVVGQEQAKRALLISAAGYHNVIMMGSPGSGKTMLASRLQTILPPLDLSEVIETSKLYSISGNLKEGNLVYQRPYRAPHHTISRIGLVGGGPYGQPGEISLSHNGILFLDELTEFSSRTIEVLRQPLESRMISISRAQYTVDFPANFIFVGAFNPCPCGFYGDPKKNCKCSLSMIMQYIKKLSGPFLDRIDLQISIGTLAYTDLENGPRSITSEQMYQKVVKAHALQKIRNKGILNGLLTPEQIKAHCVLGEGSKRIIELAFEKLHLTMRGYNKVLRIARTIADIEDFKDIQEQHLKEAFMYRSIDKQLERFNY